MPAASSTLVTRTACIIPSVWNWLVADLAGCTNGFVMLDIAYLGLHLAYGLFKPSLHTRFISDIDLLSEVAQSKTIANDGLASWRVHLRRPRPVYIYASTFKLNRGIRRVDGPWISAGDRAPHLPCFSSATHGHFVLWLREYKRGDIERENFTRLRNISFGCNQEAQQFVWKTVGGGVGRKRRDHAVLGKPSSTRGLLLQIIL